VGSRLDECEEIRNLGGPFSLALERACSDIVADGRLVSSKDRQAMNLGSAAALRLTLRGPHSAAETVSLSGNVPLSPSLNGIG